MATNSPLQAIYIVALSCAMKMLTLNEKLYRSTDFEVHRNWLSITHSLPFSQWYIEARNHWTLDYPPFFAYFERLLAFFGQFIDSGMVNVNNLNYASSGTVIFQRITVIFVSDIILAVGVYMILPPAQRVRGLILTLFSSSLILVDHIHFQYNGMMLGLLLISAALIQSGKFYSGAAVYIVLIFSKHIFLYCAPVYLVYFMRNLVLASKNDSERNMRFVKLVGIVLTISAVAIVPLALTGQLNAALMRMFPFGRGLAHYYWAPNVWAIYLTIDRVLGKFIGVAVPANVNANRVLPEVSPAVCSVLTLLAYLPLVMHLWKHNSKKISFVGYLGLGNAIAFMFGYHVHEKAILMVLVPLIMNRLIQGGDATNEWWLSHASFVSCVTLLPKDLLIVLGVTMWVAGFLIDSLALNVNASKNSRLMCFVAAPIVYDWIFGKKWIPGLAKWESSVLIFYSVTSFCVFVRILRDIVREVNNRSTKQL